MSRLNEDEILDIRRRFHVERVSQGVLAKEYGVDPSTISRITTGQTYADVGGPTGTLSDSERTDRIRSRRRSLSESEVVDIRQRFHDGDASTTELAEEYDVGTASIHRVTSGKKYEDFGGPVGVLTSDEVVERTREAVRMADIDDAADIRRRFKSGEGVESIADDYAYVPGSIHNIALGIFYQDCQEPPAETRDLSEVCPKTVRYTRWAIGETLIDFSDRIDVSHRLVSMFELRQIRKTESSRWGKIERLARGRGIDPDAPQPIITTHHLLHLLREIVSNLGGISGAAEHIGVSYNAVKRWLDGSNRPLPQNHLRIRESAEVLGIWSPRGPVSPPDEEQNPVELSDADIHQIRVLHDAGTHPSNLAMMYDVDMSTISQILKQSH